MNEGICLRQQMRRGRAERIASSQPFQGEACLDGMLTAGLQGSAFGTSTLTNAGRVRTFHPQREWAAGAREFFILIQVFDGPSLARVRVLGWQQPLYNAAEE